MSKQCVKCGNNIPCKLKIGPKIKNLQRRKYCLDCSPFGKHNTRQLHLHDKYIEYADGRKRRIIKCDTCGKVVADHCHACYQKKKEKRIQDKVHAIVGEECWVCGYDKGRQMLDFHHMDPSLKHFCVNKRTMANLAWKRVWEEMQKCLLMCCRCHRELEYGVIEQEYAEQLYIRKWKQLLVGSYSGSTQVS